MSVICAGAAVPRSWAARNPESAKPARSAGSLRKRCIPPARLQAVACPASFLRKHLGGALDHAQRIANLVRQPGGELPQRRQAFRPPRFLFRPPQLTVCFLERFRERLIPRHLLFVLHGELIHQNRRQKEEKHANRQDGGLRRVSARIPAARGSEMRRRRATRGPSTTAWQTARSRSPPSRSADSKSGSSCC